MSPPTEGSTKFILIDEGDLAKYILFDGAVVGRVKGNHKFPTDPRMSGHHARFSIRDNEISVEDSGSLNGVHVNGLRIKTAIPIRLSHGDVIEMGNHTFRLSIGDAELTPRPIFEKALGMSQKRKLIFMGLGGACIGIAAIFLFSDSTPPESSPMPDAELMSQAESTAQPTVQSAPPEPGSQSDPASQRDPAALALQAVVKELVPIGEEYDQLLTQIESQEISPDKFSSTVIAQLLPRLLTLQRQLTELPPFIDRRAEAVTKLDEALRAWAEAWGLRASALQKGPKPDPSALERAAEMEKTGFARLDEATQILIDFKDQ